MHEGDETGMKLTQIEARDILWGDSEKYTVVEDSITSTSRWSIHHRLVIKDIEDNLYIAKYSIGSTEQQDESPWEYDTEVEFKPAESYIEPVIKYRVKQ